MFQIIHKSIKPIVLSALLISQGLCSVPREIEELINIEKKKGAIAFLTCSLDLDVNLFFVDNVTFHAGQRGIGPITNITKTEGLTDLDPRTKLPVALSGPSYKITFAPPQGALPKWPPIPLALYRAGLPVPGKSVLSTVGWANLCRSTGDGVLRQSKDDDIEAS